MTQITQCVTPTSKAKKWSHPARDPTIDNLQSPIEDATAAKTNAEMKPRLSPSKYLSLFVAKYRQRYLELDSELRRQVRRGLNSELRRGLCEELFAALCGELYAKLFETLFEKPFASLFKSLSR